MLQARTRPFLVSQWDGPAGVWGALSSAAPHSLDQEAASRSASTTQPSGTSCILGMAEHLSRLPLSRLFLLS